jgi:MFS family permease
MIITMPSLCIAIFGPLAAGPLADLWGRRRLLLVALCAYTILGLAPLLFDSLFAIIASRAVVGLAEAAILTAGNALLGDYFAGEDRQKWLGYQTVVGPIAASLRSRRRRAQTQLERAVRPVPARRTDSCGPGSLSGNRHGRLARRERAVATPFPATLFVAAATIGTSLAYYVQALQLGRIFSELGVSTPSRISLIITVASVGVVIGGYLYRRLSRLPVSRVFAVILWLSASATSASAGARLSCRVLFGSLPSSTGLAIADRLGISIFHRQPRTQHGHLGGCFVGQFLSPLALSAVGSLPPAMQTVVVIGVLCIVASSRSRCARAGGRVRITEGRAAAS